MWYNEKVENKKREPNSRLPIKKFGSTHPKGAELIIAYQPPFGYPEKEEFLYARTVCEDIHDEACWRNSG